MTILKTFKIDKQEYKIVNDIMVSSIDSKEYNNTYIITPDNAFGYKDYIRLVRQDGLVYVRASYRFHYKKVMDKCLKELLKLGL